MGGTLVGWFFLLGSLLLLLLLLSASLCGRVCLRRRGLLLGRLLLLLLLLLLLSAAGHEQADDVLGGQHAVVVNLELAEDVVDLVLAELVAPRHEGVAEHLGVDLLLVVLVRAEGLHDQLVGVVGACNQEKRNLNLNFKV